MFSLNLKNNFLKKSGGVLGIASLVGFLVYGDQNRTNDILNELGLDSSFPYEFTDRPVEIYDRSFSSYFRLVVTGALNFNPLEYSNPYAGQSSFSLWGDQCNLTIPSGDINPRSFFSRLSGVPENYLENYVDDITLIRKFVLVHELQHCNQRRSHDLVQQIIDEFESDNEGFHYIADEASDFERKLLAVRAISPLLIAIQNGESDLTKSHVRHAVKPVFDSSMAPFEVFASYKNAFDALSPFVPEDIGDDTYIAVYQAALFVLKTQSHLDSATRSVMEQYVDAFKYLSPGLAEDILNKPVYKLVQKASLELENSSMRLT